MVAIDRRQVLRLGGLALAVLGTSTGVARLAAVDAAPTPAGELFAELYRGRRIRAVGLPGLAPGLRVFIDDVELHLMRLHTGGYTTPLNHYQAFRTPLAAARAAVHGLNGARLLPFHR